MSICVGMRHHETSFAARGVVTMPDGKSVAHAEIQIGDSIVMMADENPMMPCRSAETLGNTPVSFYVYANDVDGAFKKAAVAGCGELV